ncbi:MAG: aminotransferase class V-fold PLP-dependent enzyme [Clostridia bacterium]|nr:aminotransferase class V-fold PLP-dependent enzyme [Clostridia bacterium]
MIYLDNAATSFPKPHAVLKSMLDVARFRCGNPGRGGHTLARAADNEVYRCRKSLKEFFNARGIENVVFTQNATAALNICISGLIKPGERVITTDYEHNSVRRPLYRIEGLKVSKANVAFDDDAETAAEFERLLSAGADWLVISHVSNVWGKGLPLKRVCALAHRYGAKVILDAAQSAGSIKIDVSADGIDYLCAPGHKGIYGPQGTGFIIINSETAPKPIFTGGTGSNSFSPTQPDYLPDSLESGTLNTPAIAGLRAGIDFLRSQGVGDLHRRELALLKRAYHGLSALKNTELYTSPPNENDAPVLSFNIAGKTPFETAEAYDRYGICLRAGYHCAPDAHEKAGVSDRGTVRLSVGAFNTAADIDKFLEITQKISK